MRDKIIQDTLLLIRSTDEKEILNLKYAIIKNINNCSLIIDDEVTKNLFIEQVSNCYITPNSETDLIRDLQVFGMMIKE